VINNSTAVFCSKGRITLYPGSNPVSEKDLAALRDDSSFVSMCRNTNKQTRQVIMEVMSDSGKPNSELEKIAEKATGDDFTDAANKLHALSEPMALSAIDTMLNVGLLKRVITIDRRTSVVEAARKQLSVVSQEETEEK
jgi:hypothetical protein